MGLIIQRRVTPAVPDPESKFRVGSVRTYLDALESFQRDSESLLFFRGHEKHSYELKPSIYRSQEWIDNEDILFKELILRCPDEFYRLESTFQILVKMQHYSLPTRLLDLTANPLIALYFACSKGAGPTEGGEVVVLRVPKREIKYFDSDTVSVIANLSRRPKNFALPADGLNIKKFNSDSELKYLLHEIKKEKPYFESNILRNDIESVVCVKPKLDNPRVIRQDGAFLLFGISARKAESATVRSELIASKDDSRIIVLPAEKAKVLQQLDALGINQGSIYPEVQQVAEFIKRIHGPQPK